MHASSQIMPINPLEEEEMKIIFAVSIYWLNISRAKLYEGQQKFNAVAIGKIKKKLFFAISFHFARMAAATTSTAAVCVWYNPK